ncbi:hypothetical protein [Paenibacillus jilunlii]|uniref:hypothetical protein n=1 Tax=Paenibacillus jilunlii TaxID=682956 RepID=UPI001FCC90B5|nr:hypothetical protein [Paenibacillus jilunlii]
MRIILGMTWKELLRKKVMLMTLIMTAVFLLAFWFVANTVGSSGTERGSGIANGGDLINRFSNGAFIVTMGFFFGAFVIAFLAIFSVLSLPLRGKPNRGSCKLYFPVRCRAGNGIWAAGSGMSP